MATLKVCTHDRTQWILGVQNVILAQSFSVKHFDDPISDSRCWKIADDLHIPCIDVVDFQKPNPDAKVRGSDIGHVLILEGNWGHTKLIVVPAESCFLMSEEGKTIDRI